MEVDYTEIRDEKVRTEICKLMSEMLDNPDEIGIYPTSEFMWKMETYILNTRHDQGLIDALKEWRLKIDAANLCCGREEWDTKSILREVIKSINEALKDAGVE